MRGALTESGFVVMLRKRRTMHTDAEGTRGEWLSMTLQGRREQCMIDAGALSESGFWYGAAGAEKSEACGMPSALAESGFWCHAAEA